ncbi:LAFA_0E14950g1_1 [Lachancea sp. 'fantastica']|nr:LAFA_0E14950g1_1 [Lachancea sp. 'fantastica']
MSSIHKVLAGKSSGKSSSKEENNAFMNKQRTLLISSRGVTYRHRHLIQDLHSLLPQSRKEPKLDTKKDLGQLNEIAELYNCNNVVFFEARKHQDLYMWLSKPPNGPTIKFYLQNLHTMDELNFTGNCLKGSRPVLSFDARFDTSPHFKLIKEMFIHNFGVPPNARKSKPFIDHVMSFSIVDDKIWVRTYEIAHKARNQDEYEEGESRDAKKDVSLVEIGPRFVMTVILILEGSFGGPKIYENRQYVSPNVVRAQAKQQAAQDARNRSDAAVQRKIRRRENVLAADPLSNDVVFKN